MSESTKRSDMNGDSGDAVVESVAQIENAEVDAGDIGHQTKRRKTTVISTTVLAADIKTVGTETVLTKSIVVKMRVQPIYQWSGFSGWKDKDEMVLHTMSFLGASALVKLQGVCKKWQGLSKKVINKNFPAKRAVLTNRELRNAVEKYCQYNPKIMDEVAPIYGFPINRWNVSQLEDFSRIFYCMHNFNEYIGDWDVSRTKSMHGMFYRAYAFNQSLASWDTSAVTAMSWMFAYARAFNQSLQSWDCSNVVHERGMLIDATAFSHMDFLPDGLDPDVVSTSI